MDVARCHMIMRANLHRRSIPVWVARGPAAGASPSMRRYFDPEKYTLIHLISGLRPIKAVCVSANNNNYWTVADIRTLSVSALGSINVNRVRGKRGASCTDIRFERHPEQWRNIIIARCFR